MIGKPLLLLMALAAILFSQSAHASEEYSTLKKFLSARMYGEAYNELLRQELSKDEMDPKLEKLRQDLLERTKERLAKQAKISPDDPAIFTILADINFHQGNLEEAAAMITRALRNRSGPMANYIFAKILFRKGNLAQAFDQMGTILENMPDSPVVFEDFQFLYSCKNYGIATAKKLCKNSNFIRRATPLNGDSNLPKLPESPFENDPTIAAVTTPAQLPAVGTVSQPSLDDAHINHLDDSRLPDDPDDEDNPDKIDNESEDDFPEDITEVIVTERPKPVENVQRPVPVAVPVPEEDPEKEKIKKAEYWLDQAQKQFANRNYEDADTNWKKATELYPTLPQKDELRSKIDTRFQIMKNYLTAKELFKQEKYEEARPGLETGYIEEPEKTKDAPLMLGKIYLLRPQPDYPNALRYFDIVIKDKDVEPMVKRDLEWTKMEIFYDIEQYEEANKIFQHFFTTEEAFTKGQVNFYQLRYGLWYQLHKLWIHIGLVLFACMFLVVFVLRLLPALSFSLADPLTSAKRLLARKNYDKVVTILEKGLARKQPVQVEREMFELLIQAHFELKNFVRCQENARILLEKFPTSNIAWGFLAKSSMASHDTSNEAIAMYEALYKENPGKTEYLPVLAQHYAATKAYTVESMELLFTYYQTGNKEPQIVIALAEGYSRNRSMGNEVITVLEEALKIQDKIEFRELLARNYSKAGRYSDAARECIKVLSENINNMGIHVVYTSSMKKLRMLDEAVSQYKDFLYRNPGNEQLLEILAGLKKDAADLSAIDKDGLPTLPDELPMPDLPEADLPTSSFSADDIDIENFIEPPPEGFELDEESDIPLPDFLKGEGNEVNTTRNRAPLSDGPAKTPNIQRPFTPVELPTLDPFEESDSLIDEFAGELPEELGGPAEDSFASSIDDFASKNSVNAEELLTDLNHDISSPVPGSVSNSKAGNEIQMKLAQANEKAKKKKWDEVIELLSNVFASERNIDAGLLLADAWLAKSKAEMAMEIIETLDFDPEIMTDKIKDALYRTGLALEQAKKFDGALRMFDMICNADINFRDAFERSDKIYARKS